MSTDHFYIYGSRNGGRNGKTLCIVREREILFSGPISKINFGGKGDLTVRIGRPFPSAAFASVKGRGSSCGRGRGFSSRPAGFLGVAAYPGSGRTGRAREVGGLSVPGHGCGIWGGWCEPGRAWEVAPPPPPLTCFPLTSPAAPPPPSPGFL